MNKTEITIATFDKFAQRYQDKFMNMDLHHDSYNSFCRHLNSATASILELGCGPGNITKYILSKHPEYEILGTDLSNNMIELAKSNNPTASFKVMDCRDLNTIKQKFDAVLCGFCLPYISREEAAQLIADAAKLLHPKGIFYASTMEGDYEKSGFKGPSTGGPDKTYTYYHQAEFLSNALAQNGFQLLSLSRKEYPEEYGEAATDMIFIAQLQ